MKLFHYVQKGSNVLERGILSFAKNPQADLSYYTRRSGAETHDGVVRWMESCFEGRSRGIRVFSEPIRWTEKSLSLQKFVEQTDRFALDVTAMERDGLIEAAYCSPAGIVNDPSKIEYGTDEVLVKLDSVRDIDFSPVDWKKCDDALGLRFYVVPYYLLIVKGGVVLPEYLSLEVGQTELCC